MKVMVYFKTFVTGGSDWICSKLVFQQYFPPSYLAIWTGTYIEDITIAITFAKYSIKAYKQLRFSGLVLGTYSACVCIEIK